MRAWDAGGLQATLDALPPEGGVIHVPAGTYPVEKTLTKQLVEGQHLFLVGDGRGSVLKNLNTGGAPLRRISGHKGSSWPKLRITIRDLSFMGNPQSGGRLNCRVSERHVD